MVLVKTNDEGEIFYKFINMKPRLFYATHLEHAFKLFHYQPFNMNNYTHSICSVKKKDLDIRCSDLRGLGHIQRSFILHI